MNTTYLWAGGALAAAATAAFFVFSPDREEILTDLNLDPLENCASFGEEPEFGEQNRVRNSAEHIRDLLQHSRIGEFTDQYIVANDVAFCFGDPVSEFSSVAKHPRTQAYIIDDNLNDEQVALEILKSKIGKNSRNLLSYDSQLDPQNALLWSRLIFVHQDIVGLQQLLETAEYDVNSRFWHAVEADPQYGDIARAYTNEYAENRDISSALYNSFETALRTEVASNTRTEAFLTWYANALKDQLVPVVTPCMDMDMNVTLCTSLESAPPSEGTAAYRLSSKNIVEMSGVFLTDDPNSFGYISPEQAEIILDEIDEWTEIPNQFVSELASIQNRANEINDNYSGKGGIGVGVTFGRRLAFTF